jgi:hypothetical protein
MRRIAVTVVLLLAGLLTLPSVAAASPAGAPDYAALGDSYSAGIGTGVYDPSSATCLRSPSAYPAVYAATHPVRSFAFAACPGATTADVTERQLGALSGETDLVTLTIGGGNVGFSTVVAACSGPANPDACRIAIAQGVALVGTVPAAVAGLLGEIRTRAPGAQVVVLGYPHLFGAGPCTAPGLPAEEFRLAIDRGTDALNAAIAAGASLGGATFVDVTARFRYHGTCAPQGARWINPPTLPIFESYHPNVRGHASGYLPALVPALQGVPTAP